MDDADVASTVVLVADEPAAVALDVAVAVAEAVVMHDPVAAHVVVSRSSSTISTYPESNHP